MLIASLYNNFHLQLGGSERQNQSANLIKIWAESLKKNLSSEFFYDKNPKILSPPNFSENLKKLTFWGKWLDIFFGKIFSNYHLHCCLQLLFRSYSTIQVRCPNEFKALKNFGHFHGYFGHVQPFMFVGVIFRSSSIVHVCLCDLFLVIF